MNKPNIKGLLKTAQLTLGKHSPQILTGIGVAGMVTTTVLAVKATPKALKLIEEADEQKLADTNYERETNLVEKAAVTWKVYLPAYLTGAASVVCLIGACSVNTRRMAAIATAYKLSETALSEYKDAVIETIGEKKAKAVNDKVAEKKIESNPVSKNEVIVTGKGTALCYDTLSGRYFQSDMNTIKKAENELNLYLREENFISLNSLYDMLNLEHTKFGEELGWNIDKHGYVDIEVSAQIADSQEPCLVLDFSSMPVYEYWRL